MDAETLAALKASIQHWRENVEAETPKDASVSPKKCALCGMFWRANCKGCPVTSKTGGDCCEISPYPAAHTAFLLWVGKGQKFHDRWRAAAQAELDFLISLLPEGEKP